MASKVAVVTGANKGIGLAIVEGLCKQFDGVVILTARDVNRGEEAVNALEQNGCKPVFHQLDITDENSCKTLSAHIKDKYGGLDVLVNNAGMAYKMASTESAAVQAENTVACNFFGTLNICKSLFPILRPHARVVNVSSRAGMLRKVTNDELRKRFVADDLSLDELVALMNQFVKDAKAGDHVKKGWPDTLYGMSKIGVSSLTLIQARDFANDSRQDIIVNACCPGYVSTDMSSFKGHKTVEQGAETPIYLSLLGKGCTSPKGKFVAEKEIFQWDG